MSPATPETPHYGQRREVRVPASRVIAAVSALRPLMGRADLPPRVLYWIARNAAAVEAEANRVRVAVRAALEPFVQKGPDGQPVTKKMLLPDGETVEELQFTDSAGSQRVQDEVLREESALDLYVFDAERLIEEGHKIAPATWLDLSFMFADADEASQTEGAQ